MGLLSRALDLARGIGRRISPSRRKRAEREEALGRLAEATALYVELGEHEQAARLFRLRADSATDPRERLLLLAQALEKTQDESEKKKLELRRCRLALDLAKTGGARFSASELGELGQSFERLGEAALAAEAFGIAGDAEAQARALVAAGAVERLEQVLEEEQTRERAERAREELERRVRDLDAAGRRREALELALGAAGDARVSALVTAIAARRLDGPGCELEIDGERRAFVFGREILIGRADAAFVIASPAVSRQHLSLRRSASGVEVVDLGSRNGTTIAGARVDVPIPIRDRVELVLGGEVELVLSPWGEDGARIEVGGRAVLAPLGPLAFREFRLEIASDGWIELFSTDGAVYLGALRADRRVQLCRGDELCDRPAGAVRLRVPK